MYCPHCRSEAIAIRRRRTSLGYRIYFCNSCRREFNERTGTPFNDLQFPTDIVLMAVLWRLRYKLGFRDVAELLLQCGFEVSYETIRIWEYRFAPHVSENLRKFLADFSLLLDSPFPADFRLYSKTSTMPT